MKVNICCFSCVLFVNLIYYEAGTAVHLLLLKCSTAKEIDPNSSPNGITYLRFCVHLTYLSSFICREAKVFERGQLGIGDNV